jgi:hypothetical protein
MDITGPPNNPSGKPAKKIVARPDESVRQPDIVFLAGTGVNKMWFGV